jgi:hypothetical protein
MMHLVGRWILALIVLFAILSLVAFTLDWTVYKLRGSPHSTVAVSQFMIVELKGGKTEYDFLGTVDVPCVSALFPHDKKDPCWNLRRNPNHWQNVETPAY